jgi:hypothetical protein
MCYAVFYTVTIIRIFLFLKVGHWAVDFCRVVTERINTGVLFSLKTTSSISNLYLLKLKYKCRTFHQNASTWTSAKYFNLMYSVLQNIRSSGRSLLEFVCRPWHSLKAACTNQYTGKGFVRILMRGNDVFLISCQTCNLTSNSFQSCIASYTIAVNRRNCGLFCNF